MANFKDIMAMCLDGGEAMLPSLRRWDAPTGDIAKTKTLIADLNITKESFTQLDPSFFDEHFSDHRGPVASATTSKTSKSSLGALPTTST